MLRVTYEPISEGDKKNWRKKHVKVRATPNSSIECAFCEEPWPCLTINYLSMDEALEAQAREIADLKTDIARYREALVSERIRAALGASHGGSPALETQRREIRRLEAVEKAAEEGVTWLIEKCGHECEGTAMIARALAGEVES